MLYAIIGHNALTDSTAPLVTAEHLGDALLILKTLAAVYSPTWTLYLERDGELWRTVVGTAI